MAEEVYKRITSDTTQARDLCGALRSQLLDTRGATVRLLLNKYQHVIILSVFPLILTAINSNWIFTPATNNIPDPWLYLGYFQYFFEYAPAYPSNALYYVERLTWNIPGYFVYQIFPSIYANYVLHLAVYYIAIFALYSTLRLISNDRAAFMSALLMGSYPWFLRAAGWDYPDGIGIAYFLLLILFITLAIYSRHWKTHLFAAGIIHTALLVTNPFWVGFSPSWGIYFLLQNQAKKQLSVRQSVSGIFYFIMGNLSMAGILGVFYNWVTGRFFFLEESLRSSIYLTKSQSNNIGVITNYGHMTPYWHILPIVVMIFATCRILSYIIRKNRGVSELLPVYSAFLTAYAWLIFWHYYSNPLLIMFPYSSLAIPVTFLLLGILIAEFPLKFNNEQFAPLAWWTTGLLFLPAIFLLIFPQTEALQGNQLLIACSGLVGLIALFSHQRTNRLLLLTIALYSIFFYLTSKYSYVYDANRTKGRDRFLAIMSASQTIDAYYPNRRYEDFRLWFRADDNYDTFFSLAALYLYPWGSALDKPVSSKQPHPQLALAPRDEIQAEDKIVIIASDLNSDKMIEEANRALSEKDLQLILEKTQGIHQGDVLFQLYFTHAIQANNN